MEELRLLDEQFNILREWFRTTYKRELGILQDYNKQEKRQEYILVFNTILGDQKICPVYVSKKDLDSQDTFNMLISNLVPTYKKIIINVLGDPGKKINEQDRIH